ncbi:hypothetical protein HIM_04306 [Hirsutella minnesotensis 3608]|uniref:Reverse transcriptase n=1 Tax=Hirsutella minnesotensis 3608 TaxID=1043627 RepID=A0A0F8A602_9HYPO|nr:hypothetical protein HIM_04306 [Hirsutella minnesotensis 3608]
MCISASIRFGSVATARWFTKLDVRAAFHRLRVRHGDEWKTAFRTRYGQFEWLVTPFGLTGAPATFQRYINSHLHDLLDEFCSAYMDDVIIYSDGDYLDHMTKVRTVMERLRNAGLKLDLEKCAFAVKEVKYLGFIIKAGEGVTVDPEKIEAIRDWEAPTTVTGVRSFLGFANFYREFIENFAAVSEPLNNLTKKMSEWDWDASAQNAFNKLKELLITSPVLAMFHSDRETVLECDASGWAVGAVLSQLDEKSRLRPVGYFSRKFSATEVNYDIHDKELLAIVAAMEHFSGELRSVDKFIVISDHKNLQYFMTNRRLSERQVRLAETLSRYTFKIVFRAGKDNTQPDFLSRRAQDLPANGDDERLKNREFQLLKDHWLPPRTVKHHQGDYIRDQLVSAVQTRRSKTTPIDDSQAPPRGAKLFFDSALQLLWDRGMIEDEEYRNIHASVVQGNATFPSEYNLSVQIPDCEIDDRGALLRRGALWVPNWEPLRTALIQQTHDSHITGHPGRDVTLSILQRSYFWPQQYLMVRQFVRNCNVCSRSKSWRHSPQGLLRPLPIPDRFHSELSVDFMVDLPANGKDPRFLMVICDRLLGSCTLEAMDSMEAEACAERFVQCHYRFHGFPKTMTSDRGSNWVSKFWQRLCELVRTEQRLSTAYHPQTDGATERMNQEVLVYLRIFVAYAQTDWARLLPMAMLAINNRDSSVTGYSPFFLTHGYHAEPIQQTQILSRSKTDPKAGADHFIARLREGQELAQAAKATAQQIMEHQANKGRRPSQKFVVGERVWLNLKNVTTPQLKKKLSWTQAKYKVTKVIAPDVYELDVPSNIHPRFFADLLRKDPNDPLPSQVQDDTQPPPLLDGTVPVYPVEKVLRAERHPKGRELLVKWDGYIEPTWEPRDNIKLTDAFKRFVATYGEGDDVGEDEGSRTGSTIPLLLPLFLKKSIINYSSKSLLVVHIGLDRNTDVDGVIGTGEMFHETWAHLVELTIGIVILARQVHWLWPVPLIIVCGSMKSLKTLGWTKETVDYITGLRKVEMDKAKTVWWISVAYNASANALGIFGTAVTVILCAFLEEARGSRLDAETAFTTVATLAIITHPANMIMTIVPRAIASFASFERLQEYLLQPSRNDQRQITRPANYRTSASLAGVSLSDITVTTARRPESPILRNLTIDIDPGTITVCCGPNGGGKSALVKAVLGELSLVSGNLTLPSSGVGYCDQTPWLPSGSIKDISLYHRAITACCLGRDLSALPDGDATIVGSRGMNLSGGQRQRLAMARMLYNPCGIVILDDPFTAIDGTTESQVVENILGHNGWLRMSKTTVLLISNAAQHFHYADQIVLLNNGQVQAMGPWRKMKDHITEIPNPHLTENSPRTSIEDVTNSAQHAAKLQRDHDKEDLYRNTGDFSLYRYYIKSAGIVNTLAVVGCTAGYSFFITIPHYWIKWWTEDSGRSLYYATGYALLAIIAWASTSGTMWSTYIHLAPRSGISLHQSLLSAIFSAPLSFFTATEVGVTLNRFGQDITLVDRHLPAAFSALCTQAFKMAAQVLVLSRVQQLMIVSFPLCVVAIYIVQRLYLRTSRQLRVLELESQSALSSSFLETVDGLVSIRAFRWQSLFQARNTDSLDQSLRPFYVLLCLQRWLNLVLDLIVSAIAVGIIYFAVSRDGSTSGSDLGVALNLVLVANTTLIRLIESWTGLEISLGAIARIKHVQSDTPSEELLAKNVEPDSSWPSRGELQIENVSVSHNPNNVVLRSINLHIQGGQKVVICGRTGSGKSTLLMALLGLADYTGTIKVDGQDLSTVPCSIIRRRCFITIPQDPFFIPESTLRFNLDPSSSVSDDFLQGVLSKVGVWAHLSAGVHQVGNSALSEKLSDLPILSVGQSQLLAMARAIVQKTSSHTVGELGGRDALSRSKPILLLDEATSSLDSEAGSVLYRLIDSEFVSCGHTVIIVAHRLSALVDNIRPRKDVVVMMDCGRIGKIALVEDILKETSAKR